MRAEITVAGIVQGVGFRPFVYRLATENRLAGYVRNRGDAAVEIVIEGEKNRIDYFLSDLEKKKPPLAKIYEIVTSYEKDKNEFKRFEIIKSSEEAEFSGSVIPPDIAVCDECLAELRDSRNRRHDYFFITCTNCGPRYTIIERLPYDRPNTTMQNFAMCDFCSEEYKNPASRRFHAQTVACSQCGPKAYLTDNKGEHIELKDPIREAGKLLEEDHILSIKGYGGFHIATATTKSQPIAKLRDVKHRSQKPFAIMTRDLETVQSFAEISPKEAEMLKSYRKPIVLLKKSRDFYLSELVAPNLHNVGVMLPYTGLHIMLFDDVCEPAFVMTSANPPNEPIVTENSDAIKRLGSVVDFFLFHNRTITQRCDDSVVRLNDGNLSFIRRSRGYAPQPIPLKLSAKHCFLGLGAELNTTSCILLGSKAFISQHIGDVENLETLEFLKLATDHLMRLTNSKADVIVCDLHPKFTITQLTHDLGNKWGCPVVSIQHHHAHIAALMGEYGIHEMVGIACDGYGYGSNGKAWGGEILYCDSDGFQRLGHLQEQPMVGGDLATQYPLRMAAGILYGFDCMEEWLLSKSNQFPHGKEEIEVVLKQIKRGHVPKTTSCGRILDAVSVILGLCYERTYEGEPSMRLESAAMEGRDVLSLKPEIRGNVVETTRLIEEIFEKRGDCSVSDLAYSAQAYLAEGLAQLAIEKAERLNVKVVGFSGGVACNEHITLTMRKAVEKRGLKFVAHNLVPPGDGGLSFGQVVAASLAAS